MLNDKIEKIAKRISGSKSLSDAQKKEYLKLIEELKTEVASLNGSHSDDAASILNFAEVASHEALRDKRDADLGQISRSGLELAVRKFEATHPNLFASVNSICNYLAGLGI
jgi:hypothetical protein